MTIVDYIQASALSQSFKRFSKRLSPSRDPTPSELQQQQQQQPNEDNNKLKKSNSRGFTPFQARRQSLTAPCEKVLDSTAAATDTPTSPYGPLKVVTATACCPKRPNKARESKTRRDCGEDAVFVCRNFPSNSTVDRVCSIGVADGVGSYSLRGIDPSIFAWAIMEGTKEVFETDASVTCIQALTKSYEKICSEARVEAGGSTACIVSLHHGKSSNGAPVLKLTAASLGDSSFLVVRDGNIIYRSEEQLHCFNCPYQLSVPRNSAKPNQDDPSKAFVLDDPIDLVKGDIVIVATDGLTDNVFDADVAKIVSGIKEATDKDTAAKMASELLKTAYLNSRSKEAYTPFTKYSIEHHQSYIPNGKVDDITFVVALIA